MTKRDWLAVGLKCAFLAVFLVLFSQTVFFSMQVVGRLDGLNALNLIGLLAACVVSLVFLRWSDVLVARTFREDGLWSPEEKHQTVFLIACRIAGAVYILLSAANILITVNFWRQTNWMLSTPASAWSYMAGHVAGWAVQLGLTLYLLFGGKGLVRIAFAKSPGEFKPIGRATEILGIGNAPEVFSLALRVVGVVFLLSHFPRFFDHFVLRVFPLFSEPGMRGEPSLRGLIWSLVMVALCIYFLTGAKHLVRLVFREAPEEGQNAES